MSPPPCNVTQPHLLAAELHIPFASQSPWKQSLPPNHPVQFRGSSVITPASYVLPTNLGLFLAKIAPSCITIPCNLSSQERECRAGHMNEGGPQPPPGACQVAPCSWSAGGASDPTSGLTRQADGTRPRASAPPSATQPPPLSWKLPGGSIFFFIF